MTFLFQFSDTLAYPKVNAMTINFHVPSVPLDSVGDFSGARRALGHLAAAMFVGLVLFMSLKIMAFTPSPDADCLPEICGPAIN